MIEDPHLLFDLVKEAIHTLNISATIKTNSIDIRCNVCGDSAHNERIKRGGFYFYDNTLLYHCFNDGCDCFDKAWPAKKWLKEYAPTIYRKYTGLMFNRNKPGSTSLSYVKKKPKKEKTVELKDLSADQFYKKRPKFHRPKIDSSNFIKITDDHDLAKKARQECIRRRIPKEYAKTFKVAVKGPYYGRMIIPFYDENKKFIYFQARDLIGYTPKYINLKSDYDKPLFNLHNLDSSKPVVVVEGPIDSMFIANSIATLGLKPSKTAREILDTLDKYYLFDCDSAGFDEANKFLSKGLKVFNWTNFLKDNKIKYDPNKKIDVNDVYQILNRKEKFTFEELEKYFTNNYYDRIFL